MSQRFHIRCGKPCERDLPGDRTKPPPARGIQRLAMASTTQSTRPSGTTPATTSPADLKTLEGVRTRLAQLANALHTLRNEVQYTLPSWYVAPLPSTPPTAADTNPRLKAIARRHVQPSQHASTVPRDLSLLARARAHTRRRTRLSAPVVPGPRAPRHCRAASAQEA